MRATCLNVLSVVVAFVVVVILPSISDAQSAPPAAINGYYVCEFGVTGSDGKPLTYQSDVIPNTGFRPGPVTLAFRDYVNATYHLSVKSAAVCTEARTEAMARDVIKSKDTSGVKIIKTGWKYTAGPAVQSTGAPAAAPAPAAGATAAAAATSAAPAQSGHGQYVLCYSDTVASTQSFYLSADFQIDVPVAPDAKSGRSDGGASRNALDALQKEFLAYLKADRGFQVTSSFPSTCQGKPTLAELTEVRNLLHQRFSQLKFIETGWKPGVTPTATPKPSTTPSPAVSPGMSAYDKAIAAGRPASNTPTPKPSPSASAKPAAAPAVDGPPKYAYCYAYGATTAGKQHFYVSQAFQVTPGERLNEGFEKYLGTAHPGEEINASCLAPVALDAANANRQTTLDNRRKQPAKWDVIEVNWKR